MPARRVLIESLDAVDFKLDALTTDDVVEGADLYFTDARAQAAIDKAHVDSLNVDADTLDGQQGAHYLDRSNHTGTEPDSAIPESAVTQHGDGRYGQLATINTWTGPDHLFDGRVVAGDGTSGTSGSGYSLKFPADGSYRTCVIVDNDDEIKIGSGIWTAVYFQTASGDELRVGGGFKVGFPVGGLQGFGTVNAEELYEDGNRAATLDASDNLVAKSVGRSLESFHKAYKPRRLIDAHGVSDLITWARASEGTRVNEQGLIETVPADTPRIDHDPLTGAYRGVLVEEARTNELLYSEDLSNAEWNKFSNVSIGTPISKIGLSLDEIINDSTDPYKAVNQGSITLADQEYATCTAYVTAGSSDRTLLGVWATSGTARLGLNWDSSGVPTPFAEQSFWDLDLVESDVELHNDGVYRATIIMQNISGASTTITARYYVTWSTAPAATGENTFAGGFQLELARNASSYIPTEGTTATRAADLAVSDGPDFDAWWNPAGGVFVAEFISASANDGRVIGVDNGSNSERIQFDVEGEVIITENGNTQAAWSNSLAQNVTHRASIRVAQDSFLLAIDGAIDHTDSSVIIPDVTQLQVGNDSSNRHMNGGIRQLTYYPFPDMPDADIEFASVVGRDILGVENTQEMPALEKQFTQAVVDELITGRWTFDAPVDFFGDIFIGSPPDFLAVESSPGEVTLSVPASVDMVFVADTTEVLRMGPNGVTQLTVGSPSPNFIDPQGPGDINAERVMVDGDDVMTTQGVSDISVVAPLETQVALTDIGESHVLSINSDAFKERGVTVSTSTDSTTNINTSSWAELPFNSTLLLTLPGANTITNAIIVPPGIYRVFGQITYSTLVARANVGISIALDGVRTTAIGAGGYVRSSSGHNEGSSIIEDYVAFSTDTTISLMGIQLAASGTVTLRSGQSRFIIAREGPL